jgi:ribosome biogenesis GTPase
MAQKDSDIKNALPAVVTAQHRMAYMVKTESSELAARVAGRFMLSAKNMYDYPAVGDNVKVALHNHGRLAVIEEILPRRTSLVRRKPDSEQQVQVIAANVDIVFAVIGLDGDFNVRRMERLLSIAKSSGAEPAVILTKSDLCEAAQITEMAEAARAAAGTGTRLFVLSNISREGLEELKPFLSGKTACFIGSSGTGKSTLINLLIGEDKIKTGEVREKDSRGRHTTTSRQLYRLSGGGAVIDTPGMREIGLLEEQAQSVDTVFNELDALAVNCRFANCRHDTEPGCAIKAALDEGKIPPQRYAAYIKLKTETAPPPEYVQRKERALKERSPRPAEQEQTANQPKPPMRGVGKKHI